jgi:hypothetical protein
MAGLVVSVYGRAMSAHRLASLQRLRRSTVGGRAARVLLGGIVVVLLIASGSAGAAVQQGVLYKLSLEGTMSVTVQATGSPSGPGITSVVQTASPPFHVADTEIWLPLFKGAVGSTLTTQANSTLMIEDNAGPITDNETYQYSDSNGNLLPGTATCTGEVKNSLAAQHVAVASASGVVLTSDLVGWFGTESNEFQVGCTDSPPGTRFGPAGEPPGTDVSLFNFAWEPPVTGQRMAVSYDMGAFQIGDDSLGGPADDQSSVQSALVCQAYGLESCNVTFHLNASYELHKLCTGVISSAGSPGQAAGTCGGGGTPPVISKPAVKPSTVSGSGATISYTDSVPGSTATITIQKANKGYTNGKVCQAQKPKGAKKPTPCTYYETVAKFTHQDQAAAVTVSFTGKINGHRLSAGKYRLQITATSTNGVKGKPSRWVYFTIAG